jgi:hypothetical protein
MPACNLNSNYPLGQLSANGQTFTFSKNFVFRNRNIDVGPAHPSTGAVTSTDCSLSIVNSRMKIVISKVLNANNTTDYFFKFESVAGSVSTSLFCSMAEHSHPEFTIEFDSTEHVLSFIGTDDVRTGKATLWFPLTAVLPEGLFLKFDDTQNRLFINA